MKFLIINGPNMNLLGKRETNIYGNETYKDMIILCEKTCRDLDVFCITTQSNHEGAIVDSIQQAAEDGFDGIVIKSAAYAHTSIAIMDALKAVAIPTVNVHVSKVGEREAFRQIDYTAMASLCTISGHGINGYKEAIEYLYNYLNNK